MKKINKMILLFLFLALPFSQKIAAVSNASTEAVSEIIRKQAECEFGYVDNTEYFMQHDFHNLTFVDDSCIVTCADSSNFNEFGVFHVSDSQDAKRCEKILKKYIESAKHRFQSGVIYDVAEYPKFENAKTYVFGNYVLYMILPASQNESAARAVEAHLKKEGTA